MPKRAPHEPMAAVVKERRGPGAAPGIMIGDRPSTDGAFARCLGFRYGHVWSGVTPKGAVVDPVPDLIGDDLAAIARQLRAE